MPITMGDILEHKHRRMLVEEKPYVVMVTKYTYNDSDPADMDVIRTEDFATKEPCVARFHEVVEEYLEYEVGTNLYTDEPGFFYGSHDVFDEANNCSYSVSMFRRTI